MDEPNLSPWPLLAAVDPLAEDPARGVPLEGAVRHVEVAGARGRLVEELGDREVDRLVERLEACGLSVALVSSSAGVRSPAESLDAELARLARVLDVALRLGAPFVRVGSRLALRGDGSPAARAAGVERLAAFADLAELVEVGLLLENVPGDDGPRGLLELVHAVGSRRLRCVADVAALRHAGTPDVAGTLRELLAHLAIVRLDDVALVESVRVLAEGGYRGFVALPVPSDAAVHAASPGLGAVHGIAALR